MMDIGRSRSIQSQLEIHLIRTCHNMIRKSCHAHCARLPKIIEKITSDTYDDQGRRIAAFSWSTYLLEATRLSWIQPTQWFLGRSCQNELRRSNNFDVKACQKTIMALYEFFEFFHVVNRHENTNFWNLQLFGSGHFLVDFKISWI